MQWAQSNKPGEGLNMWRHFRGLATGAPRFQGPGGSFQHAGTAGASGPAGMCPGPGPGSGAGAAGAGGARDPGEGREGPGHGDGQREAVLRHRRTGSLIRSRR